MKKILLSLSLLSLSLLANDLSIKSEEKCIKNKIVEKPMTFKESGNMKCIQFEDACLLLNDKDKKEVLDLLKKKNLYKD